MKIGNAWTKTSEDGNTFLSVALDEVILEQYPFLKNCLLTCGGFRQKIEKTKIHRAGTSIFLLKSKKKKQSKKKLLHNSLKYHCGAFDADAPFSLEREK